MTPLEISIAIHYATRMTDFHSGACPPPAVKEAVDNFCRLGLLEKAIGTGDMLFSCTEGLRVYVSALCEVPPPTLRWMP